MGKRILGISIALILIGVIGGVGLMARTPVPKAQIRDAAMGIASSMPMDQKSTPVSSLDDLAWSVMNPMPTARYGAITGFYAGKIFVAGGASDTTHPFNTGVVQAFDASTLQWSSTYNVNPNARRLAGSGKVQVGSKLYIIGGITEAGAVSGQVDCYDMATNTWSTLPNACTPRYAHGVAVVGTDIYVYGGFDGVATLASAQKLNTLNNTWTAVASLPNADGWLAGAAANGKVYAFGGAVYPSRVLEYDPTGNTWTALANMPQSRVYASAVAEGTMIYLAGGESAAQDGTARLRAYSFNAVTKAWVDLGAIPASRVWPAVASSGTYIYVIGGLDRTQLPVTFTNTCWRAGITPPGTPGPVTGLQVTVYNDPMGALLQWVNPAVDDQNNVLTDLDSVCVVRYSCTDTVRLVRLTSPVIGGAMTFMDNQISAMGAYQWKVTPYNTIGVGASRSVAGFVGTEGTYTWGPTTYSWTDISQTGTLLNFTVEDEVISNVPLGFTFNFYGGNYTDINVSENGWLSFSSTGGYYMNSCLPSSEEPNNAIYPFFDDLSIQEAGGHVYYYSDASKFIVQWQNVGFYDAAGVAKFQVIIWASGMIDFVYNTAFTGPVNSATVGIEDATGANYLQLCCNGESPGCPAPGVAYRLNVACTGKGSISGTIVLDPAYGGNVTNVAVTTDKGDVAYPASNGQYQLNDIDAGTVNLTVTLAGYDEEHTQVYLPVFGELNDVDLTLIRSAPSPVTSFSGEWSYQTQSVPMNWNIPTDTTIHQFKIYRCPPNSETYTAIAVVPADEDAYEDLITSPTGIYHYYVTSVDVGPAVDRESAPSPIISPSVGTLPTYWLTCDGNYDDRVCLNWYRPYDSPVREYYYDDGGNDVGGLGFWDTGYYAIRFTFANAVTIYGLRYYWTAQATASTHDRLLIWQADESGMPGTLLYNVSANRDAGEGAFVDYALATPLQIPSGDFFVGCYQAGFIDYLGLGADDNPESFVNDTYFHSLSGTSGDWASFESDLFYYTPMIRVYAGSPTGPVASVIGPSSHHSSITSESGKDPVTGAVLWLASPVTSRSEVNVSAIGAIRRAAPAGDFASLLRSPRRAAAKASWLPPANKDVRGHLDEPDKYYIYRDGVFIHSINLPESTMFCDESVAENQQHTYKVKAAYYGADTVLVGLDSVTCMANMAPGMVPGVVARFSTYPSCNVTLTWDQVTLNEDGSPCVDLAGYRLYLDGQLHEEIPPDVLHYTITFADPESPHVLALSAVDEVPNEGPKYEVPVLCEAACNYNWVELEGDADAVQITNVGDDDNLGFFPIGFPFEFYGVTYELFRFAANGFITFESTSGSYANDCPLPTASEPNGAIYPLWDDLFPTAGGTFWYKTDVANERLIVEWSEVPYLSMTGTATFEAILYSYGGVQFQYKDVAHFESATIGIENQAGDDATVYCCNGAGDFCPINQWCICTGCFLPGTLQGTIYRGNTALTLAGVTVEDVGTGRMTVTDASGGYDFVLPCGSRIIRLAKEGYCTRMDTVLVECTGATNHLSRLYWPKIQITPGIVSNSIHVGVTSHDTLRISNPQGLCPLEYTIAMDPVIPWIHIDPDTAAVAANQTQNVILTYTPPVGANPHVITMLRITHNADSSPDTVFVDLRVLETGIRQAGTPMEFAVHQNFPNPFNPTTSIFFDLPTHENVRLDVFNVIGQKVATLVDEPMSAGYHVVSFDASALPSGLYFYRVQAGEWSALKKMMLIK